MASTPEFGAAQESTGFTVEDISVGAHAHGFGRSADGNPYTFRVWRNTLVVELYPAHLERLVPDTEDVIASSTRSVTEIDLTDERSIVAAVRDAVASAEPVQDGTTVRAVLNRIGSVLEGR